MKNILKILKVVVIAVLCSLLFSVNTYAAEDVAIDDTNFPDEIFRNYVSEKFDKNADGVLQRSELDKATSINVSSKEVVSLILPAFICWFFQSSYSWAERPFRPFNPFIFSILIY